MGLFLALALLAAMLAACGTTNKYYFMTPDGRSSATSTVVVPNAPNGQGQQQAPVIYPPMYPPMMQAPAQQK
jgi:uncharacterized lipoprotein